MIYDPKEVEKWRKICGSKNPLDYFRKLHEDGNLDRSDIPLIKHIIRLATEEENQDSAERLISELQNIISSIEGAD
ncbi:MAG TPA: hypothetical protein VFI73_01085 [Candidatus Nitrosopolaris sp.]|nr:hypothetical protein [Candidatus Nitrosopolaris sp.]